MALERRGLVREGLAAGEEELAQSARRWTTLGVSPFEIGTEAGRRTWRQLLLAIEKDLVLAGAQPACGRLAAGEVEAGGGTVDRLDGKAVVGQKQRVPAYAATEVEHVLRAARFQHRHQGCDRRVRRQPVGATLRRCPPLIPRFDRRRRHLRLPALSSAVLRLAS